MTEAVFTFIGGAVFGAVVSLFFTALWQEKVNLIVSDFLRKQRGKKSKIHTPSYSFSFGPLKTNGIVVDGDGTSTFTRKTLRCFFDNTPIMLPQELQDLKENFQALQDTNKAAGKKWETNGKMYALTAIQRNYDEDGCLNLDLTFQPSDWFTYRAITSNLDTKVINGNHHSTLREKYITPFNLMDSDLQPIPYISHSFSVAMCLLTNDNKFIIIKRASNVIYPDRYNVAINETLERDKDKGANGYPDLWNAAKRGTLEEMGFEPDDDEIKFFSLGTDIDSHGWGMQGLIITKKSLKEIIELRDQLPTSKREDKELIALQFEPKKIIDFVIKNGPWNGASPVIIYNSLVYKFKKETVDKILKEASRNA